MNSVGEAHRRTLGTSVKPAEQFQGLGYMDAAARSDTDGAFNGIKMDVPDLTAEEAAAIRERILKMQGTRGRAAAEAGGPRSAPARASPADADAHPRAQQEQEVATTDFFIVF